MNYQELIKLCMKYNLEYKTHYGKTKSYLKLKRKVEQHQHIINKKRKQDNWTKGSETLSVACLKTRQPLYYFIGDA